MIVLRQGVDTGAGTVRVAQRAPVCELTEVHLHPSTFDKDGNLGDIGDAGMGQAKRSAVKKTKESASSLRESLFSQIPPFISSIPLPFQEDW